LATAVVALREADESTSKANVASLNTALWEGVVEFGDLHAFLMLVTMQCPPNNVDPLSKELAEVAVGIQDKSPGVFLFQGFVSENHPDKITIATVISDKVAYEHLTKLDIYAKWMKVLTDLEVNILKVKFIGNPELPQKLSDELLGRTAESEWPTEVWNQTSGFARGPVKEKVHGKTWIVDGTFYVPNDNLPTINVLNTAFMAEQFDWDPTCFFARVGLDLGYMADETRFAYGGVYLMGYRPWSRAIEFGEGKSETNWVATAAHYGVHLEYQNFYGADSPKFKDKVKQLGANVTTFWDFAFGYDRYKTERYTE